MNKDLSRGNKYPLFPDYDFDTTIIRNQRVTQIKTTIRKQNRNGVWMFWDVVHAHLPETDHGSMQSVEVAVREFISKCYEVIILGSVDSNVVDASGNPIFKRDPNQESEYERLSRL